MDIVGSLPRTSRGNQYILTVVDYFTKHAKAYPLTDQEAPTVARAFLNEFVSRYGVPYVIHIDQGTNFESNLFKEICKLLKIEKTPTSPYHPQCDGQVERMNRTLVELLSINVPNPTDNWDLDLGLTLLAYRSAVQSSTGFTLYYLLYGKEMRLPLDMIYRPPSQDFSRTQYAQEIRLFWNVLTTLQGANFNFLMNVKKTYDRRTRGEHFKPGDSVWLWSPAV